MFDELTSNVETLENIEDMDELIDKITNALTISADQAIPKKPTSFPHPPVPWYNRNLKLLKIARNRAERSMRNNPTIENRIAYKRARAKFQYTVRREKSESWKNFLSTINQHTSLHKIWNKVQKISGKYRKNPNPVLKDDDGNILDPKSVADTLASTFSKVSADQSYSNKFIRYKTIKENSPLIFDSHTRYDYKEPFTRKEFDDALSSTSETSPGHDKLTYSMIKNTNYKMKRIILRSFNKIYQSNKFPKSWSLAIIIPILKPQKKPYRPRQLQTNLTNSLLM